MTLKFDPILFDLDGTLIDSGADIAAAVNKTLGGFDLPLLDPDRIIGFVGDGVRRLVERTLAQYDSVGIDAFIPAFRVNYRDGCLDQTRPFPGIPELLESLRRAKMGVVTNKPGAFARQILDGLDLTRHFQVVIGGDEAPLKPRPDPLNQVIDRLRASARGGLMVGDHPNDILAGQRAGLATCAVTWGFDKGEGVRTSDPDHLCTSVEALRELLIR